MWPFLSYRLYLYGKTLRGDAHSRGDVNVADATHAQRESPLADSF